MKNGALYRSWGGLPARAGAVIAPRSLEDLRLPPGPWTAFGNGRSYGDSCLPDGGALIDMRGLNRILAFDPASGRVRAEAGVLLSDLIDAVAPHGWFPAVVPGTRHVTLGGAVANDIHGKNHHVKGTFGEHVIAFELLRSDRPRTVCTAQTDRDLFRATIGGLGLTGVISWVEIQLMRVSSPDVMQEALPLTRLSEFFTLVPASERSWEYCVAWIDSLARGRDLGRGVLLRAAHAPEAPARRRTSDPLVSVPFTPPFSLIGGQSLHVFNHVYRRTALRRQGPRRIDSGKFFFPLDSVGSWNRLYGPRGLRQHQCVIPLAAAEPTIAAMLEETHRAAHGSFLTVLKLFGPRPAAGMMSFPQSGATLTLDFPYRGAPTDALLDRLDAMVLAAGGRINPYKDARMTPSAFASSFPAKGAFERLMDPMAQSAFAARVGLSAKPPVPTAGDVSAAA